MFTTIFVVTLLIGILAGCIIVPLVVLSRDLFGFRDESRREARKSVEMEEEAKDADIYKPHE